MITEFLELCNDIISISRDIRFAGVIDARGKLIAHQYNTKINALLPEDSEMENMLVRSAIIEGVGSKSEYKLGSPVFTIRKFANVILLTMPLQAGYRLCVSSEPGADYTDVVKKMQNLINSKS